MEKVILETQGGNHNIVFIRDQILKSADLYTQWKEWATKKLGIPEHVVVQYETGIRNATKTYPEVVFDILSKWKARNGKDATIDRLVDSLRESNMIDGADYIRDAYSSGLIPGRYSNR